MKLFWAQGYEGTSLRDLTGAMGISPPSLYAAFGSKEALYREALERYRATTGVSFSTLIEEEPSVFAVLSRILRDSARAFADSSVARGCMISIGMLTCAPEHVAVAEEVASLRRSALAGLRDLFRRAVTGGQLPSGTDVDDLARFYASVIQGMSVQARDGASAEELEAIVALALRAWPGATEGGATGGRP